MPGFQIADGNEVLRFDLEKIVELIARDSRWVHPKTFRLLPVWAPHTARGRPLYDATWTRRRTNTRRATGVTVEKWEGNIAAVNALMAAMDVARPRPKNWTVCHIWGYDDPSFRLQSSVVQNPKYFSCVGNMIWLPTALKGFTDTIPEIKTMLRICAFYLYGWVCELPAVKDQAERIKSGWILEGYPRNWPCKKRSGILPPGTAPFTERVERAILTRKKKIKADLENAALVNYPRDEVKEVLQFWKTDLG